MAWQLLTIGLTNAVIASVLAVLICLGSRCRWNAHLAAVLWTIVLLRFVMPPMISFPVEVATVEMLSTRDPDRDPAVNTIRNAESQPPVLPANGPVGSSQPTESESVNPSESSTTVRRRSQRWQSITDPSTRLQDARPSTPLLRRLSALLPHPTVWVSLWLGGAALTMTYLAVNGVRFQRLIGDDRLSREDVELTSKLEQLCARLNVQKPPRLRVVDARISPLLWTWWNGVTLIVPRSLISSLSSSQQEMLLSHELAHLLRRDHLSRWLEAAVQSLYWWLPIVPWIRRQLHAAQEECCDTFVQRHFPQHKLAYCDTLLAAGNFLQGARCTPLWGSELGSTSDLKRRIRTMLEEQMSSPVSQRTLDLCILLGLFVCVMSFRGVNAQPASQSEQHADRQQQPGKESTGLESLTTDATRFMQSIRKLFKWDEPIDQTHRSSGPAGNSLTRLISGLRKEKKLVGLAAMVRVDKQVEVVAAHGERKSGSGVPLEIGDRWHLGGITKSITATMIARLVESGQMQWSDTLGEVFPEASIHAEWKPVTLWQLLTDTARAPRSFSLEVRKKRPALGSECTQARREAVLNVIYHRPEHPPGEKFSYSNVGYTIAGAMAEKATGVNWEELVKREVFEPLELTSAGFGPPKSTDETLEQPRGHTSRESTLSRHAWKRAVSDDADNTPIMGPAGSVHMTLNDLCTYAMEHLRGNLGEGKLLSAETYHRLHTPELDQYACGWIKNELRTKGRPTMYWHNGSNTLWYALVVFIPEKNMVVAVTSNDGDIENAEAAAWEIVKASVSVDPDFPVSLPSTDYPKKSPFAAVRWQGSQPEIKLGEEWLKLVLLDDLSAAKIVEFSQQTYGDKWRKRFEEDLVELLTRMGHPPRDKVMLIVQSLTSSKMSVREDVPMTEENRRAIYRANRR